MTTDMKARHFGCLISKQNSNMFVSSDGIIPRHKLEKTRLIKEIPTDIDMTEIVNEFI